MVGMAGAEASVAVAIESTDDVHTGGVGELTTALRVISIPAPSPWRCAPQALDSSYVRTWKPVIDRVGAAALLAGLMPVGIAVGIAVRCSLGRKPIFRQPRVGRFGNTFTVYKFRTMIPDRRGGDDRRQCSRADYEERRQAHKSPDDPRLTGIGRVLRASSLDEIPQLVNVLKGEMSLVGPRPELIEIIDRYEQWQHLRHLVKPGMTGLWQVTKRGNSRAMHLDTAIDLAYIEDISFRTDMRILVRTAVALFSQRGH
jgi:lipopolysaccharide/colanic/teichoic acid biosynthesis glycosyltransferase